jgi:hypothetical protein
MPVPLLDGGLTESDFLSVKMGLDVRIPRKLKPWPKVSGFKYEAAWLRAPDYREMVEKAWTSLSDGPRSLQSTWSNLQYVASTLKTWSIESFGCVRKEIKKLEGKLKAIRL